MDIDLRTSGIKSDLLLAIDVGTSGVKAGAFDSEGRLVARAYSTYDTLYPRPGWAEQDPESWWMACCKAVKTVVSQIDSKILLAICVTGLAPAAIFVDGQGQPVRPSPIWSDYRSQDEQRDVTKRLDNKSVSSMLPRLLWLKRNEPANYRKTRWIFQSFEYISFQLTGEAACIGLRPDRLPWTAADIETLDLDPNKFPSRLCQPGEILGPVLSEVACSLGLPRGLSVIAGTVDSFASWIGTATFCKGTLCNTMGTSSSVALAWDEPFDEPQRRVSCMPHVFGRGWIIASPMSSGGLMLDWLAGQFYGHVAEPFETITKEAASVPVGADGLIALPYLAGERSPIFDSNARAVFFGISKVHTRAHFARAALESIAFATRDVCEVIIEAGGEIEEVRLAGYPAQNRLWSQMKADVLGRRVLIPEISDSGLAGAAILAGWGMGRFEDIEGAARKMVRFRVALEPNLTHYAKYTRCFEFYRDLYQHLKDSFAKAYEMNEYDSHIREDKE